jgi:hypothetical protein
VLDDEHLAAETMHVTTHLFVENKLLLYQEVGGIMVGENTGRRMQ